MGSMKFWPAFACLCWVSSSFAANMLVLKEEFTTITLPVHGNETTVKCANDRGSDLSWLINSLPVTASSVIGNDEVTIAHKGSGGVEGTVSFVPALDLNNTTLKCLVYDINEISLANYTAILIIEDVPQPPSPRISVTNGQVAYVSWDPPYSGVVYHITGYHITLTLTDGITVRHTLDNTSLSFNYTLSYDLLKCTYITVSLTAENMVGSSSPGTVTQLLPRVLSELQLDTRITYTSDNQPHIRTSFVFPEFCESSNATYFPLLYDEENKVVFTSKEKKGNSGVETSIIVPEDVVKTDRRYRIVVVVRTTESSRNASQNIDTTRNGSRSTEPKPGGLRPGIGSSYYILAGAVAGFIVLLVLIIVIVAGILCLKRKLKSRKKVCSETVLTRMVPNPVYDTQTSAIYDEIPYNNNGFNLVDEGYTSVSTTPEQVRAQTSNIKTSNQADGEEEYTEMKPAGTVLPRLSLLSESNTTMADHDEQSRTTSINNRPENQYHFE